MITKINEKWELHTFEGDFTPMLFGPRAWCFEIDYEGDLVFECDYDCTMGHMPLAAMAALMEAHDEYLAQKKQ